MPPRTARRFTSEQASIRLATCSSVRARSVSRLTLQTESAEGPERLAAEREPVDLVLASWEETMLEERVRVRAEVDQNRALA